LPARPRDPAYRHVEARQKERAKTDEFCFRRERQVGLGRHVGFAVTRHVEIAPKLEARLAVELGRQLIR
jgi:hypothetical protein